MFVAQDKEGNVANSSQQFTLDGSYLSTPLERLPQLLLLTDFKSLVRMK